MTLSTCRFHQRMYEVATTGIHGGIAYIEHYVLRWYLWRAGYMSWNSIRFLDYAAERILLCKIGGGYMFSHRLLLDYFVTCDTISASGHEPLAQAQELASPISHGSWQ